MHRMGWRNLGPPRNTNNQIRRNDPETNCSNKTKEIGGTTWNRSARKLNFIKKFLKEGLGEPRIPQGIRVVVAIAALFDLVWLQFLTWICLFVLPILQSAL